MFISLKIENFRSIRDEVTFNLSAPLNSNHHPDHVYDFGDSNIGVLRSVGIYGPNASGKSNILKAFDAVSFIIVSSGDLKDGAVIPCYMPYKLSKEKTKSPTKFTIEFLLDDIKYIYFVSYNSYEILEEVLDYYPSRSKANIFTRGPHDDWESIKFGGHYKGGAKKLAFFKNNAYLSKAGDNASTPKVVRDIYNLFNKNYTKIGYKAGFNYLNSTDSAARENITTAISNFLSLIDTGINKITFKEVDATSLIKLPEGIPEGLKAKILAENSIEYIFEHRGEDGDIAHLKENEESDGTQRLFKLSPLLITAFITKLIIIFDELDNSFHPHIADLIIKLFNDPTVNKYGSQLIFSTHNIQVMNPEKMRRDQIWLTEKNDNKTELYSLADFDKNKVKNNTPYSRWYDDGRFGAVPKFNYSNIKDFFTTEEEKSVNEVKDSDVEDIFGKLDESSELKSKD